MVDLKSQRRLAAKILRVGQNRVWIDPEKIDDAEVAITREEIRKLIHEHTIKSLPEKGISHARARIIHEKRKKKRRYGPGSRSGSAFAKISKKDAWMSRVRALRKRLRELKANKIIAEDNYRKLYKMASSGRFVSVGDLERYLKVHDLWRKR
jgi:large subunit ribosomal protein L19e